MNAYIPYLQKKLASMAPDTEQKEKREIVKLTYFLICAFAIVGVLSILGGWVILNYIVDEKYKESFVFVPYLIFGLWIYNVYHFSIQFIYKQKKTLILGLITFTGSIVQMVLSYVFIKSFGAIGVAYSAVIGSFIISTAIFIYSHRVYPMPWLKMMCK